MLNESCVCLGTLAFNIDTGRFEAGEHNLTVVAVSMEGQISSSLPLFFTITEGKSFSIG